MVDARAAANRPAAAGVSYSGCCGCNDKVRHCVTGDEIHNVVTGLGQALVALEKAVGIRCSTQESGHDLQLPDA
jgi:hypothetical protein